MAKEGARPEEEHADPESVAHFRILGRLGAGGMGVVYRAKDEALRRTVAVKLLRETGGDAETRQRFLREARSAAAITHPNVAVIYQVGEADGRLYIAMELVEGESLRTRLGRGRLDAAKACELATQMARGLAAAHEKGIVHRDLKPENVMITPDGAVKLLDFGLAKQGIEREDSGPADVALAKTETLVTSDEHRVMGTAEYMSPEQAVGKPLDVRSDVFSFGVVLYEMLTGVRPFQGSGTGDVILSIVGSPAPPLGKRAPGVDAATTAIVMRCLAKAPAERFANAGDIVTALCGQSRNAATLPPAGARKPKRRAAPLVALLVVAIALVGALVLVRHRASWLGRLRRPAVAPARSAPTRAVTRIIDLPPPRTSVPAAAAEFVLGLQAIYYDNSPSALDHFTKAAALDPAMPEAHLRLSMVAVSATDSAMRIAEFQKAAERRMQLTERDRALMDALQPVLQPRNQDMAEADRRLRGFAQRYPTDVEPWTWLGVIHAFSPEGLAPAEHALKLDPGDAQSWENKGLALLVEGKAEEARAAFEQCDAVSITSSSCLSEVGEADTVLGRCADFVQDASKAAGRNPLFLHDVLWALASTGASAQALEETVMQLIPAVPPAEAPELQRLGLEARLAILAGDFARASKLAAQESATLAADAGSRYSYGAQYQLATQLLDIALETGDGIATRRVASDFVSRSSAWPRDASSAQELDLALYFARLAFPATEAAPPSFETQRRAWIDARLAMGAYRGEVWNYAYASPALTAAEARAALDALAELAPATPARAWATFCLSARIGSPEADAGRVYLLAGRVDEAVDHLRRAVAQCDLFTSTLDHVRAELNLGRALELKGDRAGACEAYGKVLAQWGHAKPRSVTADEARARSKALRCEAR